MASRYWVSTGNWSSTNTANWSTSSGGAGGASVPTSADDVFFTDSSGNCTVASGYTPQCLTANFTGYAYPNSFTGSGQPVQIAGTSGTVFTGGSTAAFFSVTFEITSTGASTISLQLPLTNATDFLPSFSFTGGTYSLNLPSKVQDLSFTGSSCTVNNSVVFIYGNLTASVGMTFGAGGNLWTFAGTSAQYITSNGKTLDFPVTIASINTTVVLLDHLVLGETRTLTLTVGRFDANNRNVTVGFFSSSNSNIRSVAMGIGTWTLTGTGWNTTATNNLTLTFGIGSVINLTSTSNKIFYGGGKTYYYINQGGSGSLSIAGANTFNNITNSVQPATIIFPASTTTVSNFGLSGTAGKLVTIECEAPNLKFNLSKTSGTVTPQYLSIKNSNAVGGATWLAQNSVDAGNNTGWAIWPAAGFFSVMRR